jgi:hypothetical protein
VRLSGQRSASGRWHKRRSGKPERKRPFVRPRHRWEDSIKKNLQEVGCGGMELIDLAQYRDGWQALVNVGMNLRVP